MENVNFTIILSVCVAVLGWIITHKNSLKHEVFKMRLEKRMTLFEQIISSMSMFADAANTGSLKENWPEIKRELADARVLLKFYGKKEEILQFENMIGAIDLEDLEKIKQFHNGMVDLAKDNLRKELNLK